MRGRMLSRWPDSVDVLRDDRLLPRAGTGIDRRPAALVPGRQFIGIDMRAGPGVDSVEDVENLPRDDDSIGTVIALNVFEHVERFWQGFAEVERVLRPDGLLLVSCPFYFHIHRYPRDYWRFTPDALESLLRPFPTKIIGWHGPLDRPLSVWALAAGVAHPRITDQQHQAFREGIRRYSRQRVSLPRRLRYRLGRVLCGSHPLAPYLQAEHFDTVLFR